MTNISFHSSCPPLPAALPASYKVVWQDIKNLKPGALYNLSLWARTARGSLNLEYSVKYQSDPHGGSIFRHGNVTDAWTEFTWRFNATRPALALFYASTYDDPGLQLDDISIVEEVDVNLVKNPGFEDATSAPWSDFGPVKCNLQASNGHTGAKKV